MVRATLVSWQPPREESTASHGMNHTFSFILVSILSWMVLLTFAGILDNLRTRFGASHQSHPGTTAQYQQIVVSNQQPIINAFMIIVPCITI